MTMGGGGQDPGWRLERFEVVGIGVRRFYVGKREVHEREKDVSNGVGRSAMTATPNMPDYSEL